MRLLFELPQTEKRAINEKLKGEPILYCTPYDIGGDGNLTEGWIVITRNKLFNIHDGEIILNVNIKEAKNYKSYVMVGNGILEADINGETMIIARYSMKHVPRYAYIARILNLLAEGKKINIKSDEDENICPKCGRALKKGSKVCRHCLNKAAVLKRLMGMAKPHWKLLAIAVALFWVLTGISLVTPYVHRLFIDNCLLPKSTKVKPGLSSILFYVGLITLLQILNTLVTYVRGKVMVNVGSNLSAELRNMVYKKIQSLSLDYLSKRKTGDLMNRVTKDTERIKGFIQNQAVFGINQILILIGICIILFATNWKLALMIILPMPVVILFIRITWKKVHSMLHKQWRSMDKANSLLQDILSGIRIVKSFGQEEKEIERFKSASRDFADCSGGNEKYFNTIFPAINYVMGAGQFFVMYYGGKLVLKHEMQIGELVQFTQYVGMLYGSLNFMSFLPRMFADAMTAVERIFEIIDAEPDIKDSKDAKHKDIKGEIILKNVTFGYHSYEPVLENINMDVTPGEMIGLVGHSGAGKSTLINLIMRLYDVDDGEILIDGVDIKDISQKDLRSQIGVVLQENFLFTGTILENIRYSKPNASLEEIITAAKIANAHDFIIRFPDGYDTMVGENGHNLSGGERQRISIARAILNNPKILILDEATASLDIEAEQQIQEALGRLVKDRTTFAIAHRLSTLKNANRLLVIDRGKQAEMGTHDELIRKKGIYYRLVMAQRQMTRVRK
ncbi:MAG: ABC transporter ATP-binding protein [Clostridiales bacterium]|nr:ABC transporter ATP-binding protein [Clostridiales bacterium]